MVKLHRREGSWQPNAGKQISVDTSSDVCMNAHAHTKNIHSGTPIKCTMYYTSLSGVIHIHGRWHKLTGLQQCAETTKRFLLSRKTQRFHHKDPPLKMQFWKYTSRPNTSSNLSKGHQHTRGLHYKAQAWLHTQYNSFSDSFILPPSPFLSSHSLLLFSLPLAAVGGIRGEGGGAVNDDNAAAVLHPDTATHTHTHSVPS